MSTWASFGEPSRFQISLRWTDDPEPLAQRPAYGGWSTGEVRLIVGDLVLTRRHHTNQINDSVSWYLLPLLEWVARNWICLFHEERFAWIENSAAPGSTAAFLAMRRTIDASDESGQATYSAAHAWWSRHALRAADSSALYPDIAFRRLGDDVEISWTARPPVSAPDGFRLALAPGAATFPVADVATPLWGALDWAASTAASRHADHDSVVALKKWIATLKARSTDELEAGYLPSQIFEPVVRARARNGLLDTSDRLPDIPAIVRLDDAVLMFGGVSPDLASDDVDGLLAFMASRRQGHESERLADLVDTAIGAPLTAPFEEGYDLAERLLDRLGLPGEHPLVDIHGILSSLGIDVLNKQLLTSSIRGVAIAGMGYSPGILINAASRYNDRDVGRRFTLAHELCHILHDRRRARRIAHVSGAWASVGVEKRANAFAAMLLMPRDLVRRSMPDGNYTKDAVRRAANSMQVGMSALIEHLYNTAMIDEAERDALRMQFRPNAISVSTELKEGQSLICRRFSCAVRAGWGDRIDRAAEDLGVSPTALRQIMSGKAMADDQLIFCLVEQTGVTFEWLFQGKITNQLPVEMAILIRKSCTDLVVDSESSVLTSV